MGSCRTSFFDLNLVRLAPNWNVGMSKIPPLRGWNNGRSSRQRRRYLGFERSGRTTGNYGGALRVC